MTGSAPQAQIYTYKAADSLYGLSWSVREDKPFRFAVGSFIQNNENYVDIINYDESRDAMVSSPSLRVSQPFPATKIKFLPSRQASNRDLLITTSKNLSLWNLGLEKSTLDRVLDAADGEIAPLTSFDWNQSNNNKVVTSSINKKCVMWDIEHGVVEGAFQVHDSAVHDVAFGAETVFATCSADGSARILDCRTPQASTVVYSDSKENRPLLRVGWSRQDPRIIATFASRSSAVILLDLRVPGTPLLTLTSHTDPVNAFSLAPHTAQFVCTASDDRRALIWDLSKANVANRGLQPTLSYVAAAEVVALEWSPLSSDHIAICYTDEAQVLRV